MTNSELFPVFDIERLHFGLDGDGVRTLIGLAGCPLNCRCCLNPHARTGGSGVILYTPEQLYEAVKLDDLYFRSTGGGLTFGGGEPLLHGEAISRLAALCPDSWRNWVETSLYVPQEQVALAVRGIEHFLVDIKTTDPAIYRAYTGGDVELPLENLRQLLCLAGPERITVRLPKIPGFTTEEQLRASEEALQAMGVRDIDHLIYRKVVDI